MYLFSRTRTARADKVLEAMPHAVEIASKVTQITGLDIFVWNYRFGQPVGTMMWSCRLDSQSQLFEATEKLAADATYVDMVLGLSDLFEGPSVDQMMHVVSANPGETPAKYIQFNTAKMAAGKYAQAIEFGVKLQQYAAESLDRPTFFVSAAYGGFGDVGWLTGSNTLAELDAGAEWQQTDAGFHEMVTSAADLFVEGSGEQLLIERIN